MAWLLCAIVCLGFQSRQAAAQADVYLDYPKDGSKVEPLQWSAMPHWMTIDFDLRSRTENQSSLNFIAGNDQLYDLTRIRGGLTLRPTPWLTGYLQFHYNNALGLPLRYVAANMREQFDDRQAWLKFDFKPVSLIAGRQELKFGSERLVGISNWTNNSRTWDGFRAKVGDANTLELFTSSVVTIHPTALDTHGAGLTFHGAVGSITTWVPHTVIQPYVYFRNQPRVKSQQGNYGSEIEVTPGVEVSGKLFTWFDYDMLGALQRGDYSTDSIHSGAGYVNAGFIGRNLPWRPRLRAEFDYASGNAHRDLNRIGTFDQQYPSNHNAFGLTDILGFQNIRQRRLNLDLNPRKNVKLLFQQEWLNAATTQDSIYNGAAGVVVAPPPGGFLHTGLGREFDASGSYTQHQYWLWQMGVGHFSPDGLMRENGHGAPQTLCYLSLTYRFTVNKVAPAP